MTENQRTTEGHVLSIDPNSCVVGITHKERHSYAAMKRYVAARAAMGLVVLTPPYTCVEVKYAWTPRDYIVQYGFSKCAPGDVWDAERGLLIARGRAVAAIARELMTREG